MAYNSCKLFWMGVPVRSSVRRLIRFNMVRRRLFVLHAMTFVENKQRQYTF